VKCCEDEECKIIQIMPPGNWRICFKNGFTPDYLVGFALKSCGSVIPLTVYGSMTISDTYEEDYDIEGAGAQLSYIEPE